MKKRKFILGLGITALLAIGSVILPIQIKAEELVTSDGFKYAKDWDGKSYYISGYQGEGGEITIPSKIDGKTVKSITSNAFEGNNTITKITIGNGIESLGNETFGSCSKLTEICIPASLKEASNAFVSCESLTKFTVAKSNKKYYTIDGVLMRKNEKDVTLCAYPGGLEGAYTIPKKVKYIGEQAFYGAAKITKVTIPSTCKEIYPNGFDSCPMLNTVIIKEGGLSVVSWKVFAHCTALSEVSVPSTMTMFSQGAFMGCTKLTTLDIDKSNKYLKVTDGVIYSKADSSGRMLYELLNSVKLKDGVFTIPKDVDSIGNCAFGEIEGLTTLDFSKSKVTSFGPYQFEGFKGSTIIIKKGSDLAASIYNEDIIYTRDGSCKVKYVK